MRRMGWGIGIGLVLAACGGPPGGSTVGSAAPALEEGQYRIDLDRDAAVGDRYRQSGTYTRRQVERLVVDGQAVPREATEDTLTLVADSHVTEVNARGQAVVLIHTVERAVWRDAEGEHDVVPPGSVVRVRRVPRAEGPGVIELVDGTLSEEAVEQLDIAFTTTVSPTGDEHVFGTDSPQRIGDTWPINVARATQDLNKVRTIRVTEEHTSGEAELLSVGPVRGVECLQLRAEMRSEGFELTTLPEGSTLDESQMRLVMTGAFPTDGRTGRLASSTRMRMTVSVQLPDPQGREVRFEMTVEQASEREFERR